MESLIASPPSVQVNKVTTPGGNSGTTGNDPSSAPLGKGGAAGVGIAVVVVVVVLVAAFLVAKSRSQRSRYDDDFGEEVELVSTTGPSVLPQESQTAGAVPVMMDNPIGRAV